MFTNDEASNLMLLKKQLRDPMQVIDLAAERNRLELFSPDHPDYSFLIDIGSNKKITFKVSMHAQEDNSKVGLFRVDFKGRHQNPAGIGPELPMRFHPYVGKWFEIDEPHAHFYVAGYKPLAWALPLSDISFSVGDIHSMTDFQSAVVAFSKHLNVTSTLQIQSAIA